MPLQFAPGDRVQVRSSFNDGSPSLVDALVISDGVDDGGNYTLISVGDGAEIKTRPGDISADPLYAGATPHQEFQIGERVEAFLYFGDPFSEAIVFRFNRDGSYKILFTDTLLADENLPDRHIRPFCAQISVNIDSDVSVDVSTGSEEGDDEATRDEEAIQEFHAILVGQPLLAVGTRVNAYWKGGECMSPGVILARNEEGSYYVQFDNGYCDENVLLRNIRC